MAFLLPNENKEANNKMIKSKRYRIIKLLIQTGDVILDTKLGSKVYTRLIKGVSSIFNKQESKVRLKTSKQPKHLTKENKGETNE